MNGEGLSHRVAPEKNIYTGHLIADNSRERILKSEKEEIEEIDLRGQGKLFQSEEALKLKAHLPISLDIVGTEKKTSDAIG